MLDELKLPATIFAPTAEPMRRPSLALWEHDEARLIAETTETITRHFGTRPLGWMGPAAAENRVTPNLLVEAGYTQGLGWWSQRWQAANQGERYGSLSTDTSA